MAITDEDVKWFRSSSGDSAGGLASVTEIVSGDLNDLWPDQSDVEVGAAGSRTRKDFLANESGADSLTKPQVWVDDGPDGMNAEEVGVGFDDADDDDAAQGNMTAWTGDATVEVSSDGADTRTATIVGVDDSDEPASEDVVLDGTTPVESVIVWSIVYAVKLSAESATRTVTVKQGAAGTTRGTIGVNKETCFLWLTPTSIASAIKLETMAPGAKVGFWHRQSWAADGPSGLPASSAMMVKEDLT